MAGPEGGWLGGTRQGWLPGRSTVHHIMYKYRRKRRRCLERRLYSDSGIQTLVVGSLNLLTGESNMSMRRTCGGEGLGLLDLTSRRGLNWGASSISPLHWSKIAHHTSKSEYRFRVKKRPGHGAIGGSRPVGSGSAGVRRECPGPGARWILPPPS